MLAVLTLFVSCSGDRAPSASPPGYDLNKPYLLKLPLELDEISGLTYYAKDKSLFAITDELGLLYKITPGSPTRLSKWKFGNPGDYEEVVLVDSTFYILESRGNISELRFLPYGGATRKDYRFPYDQRSEFESLYYDDSLRKLVMICKDCDADKKKLLSTFTFDPSTHSYSDQSFSINIGELAKKMGVEKFRFKPSAANLNPVTKQVYIISAVNKLMLVTDRTGRVLGQYPLASGQFKQPEGLCFTNDGKLVISNEAADVGTGNLLIYTYKK